MLSVYKYVCRRLKMCGYSPYGYVQIREDKLYDLTDVFYEFTDMFYKYLKYEEITDYLTFFLFFITLLCLICVFNIVSNLEKRLQSLEKDHPLLEPLLAV